MGGAGDRALSVDAGVGFKRSECAHRQPGLRLVGFRRGTTEQRGLEYCGREYPDQRSGYASLVTWNLPGSKLIVQDLFLLLSNVQLIESNMGCYRFRRRKWIHE